MMTTKNTATQAVHRARQWSTYTPVGMCARFVSDCLSNGTLPYTNVGSAKDAYNLAKQRETSTNPPPGVPVYWSTYNGTSRYDHVALSVGNGRVRSTDYPTDGRLGECTLAEMGKRWPGMRYKGWSRDFAGDPIPGIRPDVRTYTVKAGDTLSSIASRYYGSAAKYPVIVTANKISNPNVIAVGQRLVIPYL